MRTPVIATAPRDGDADMAAYHDETVPGGPRTGPSPRVDTARLWAGGVATAVVAALVGLVGVLVVRAVFKLVGYAAGRTVFDDAATVVLCVAAAVAALAGTGLVHLLLLATPRPLAYFGWIGGLLTAVAALLPFVAGGPIAVAAAHAVIHLVIGLVIGSLLSGAASSATRPAGPPRRPVERR
jgi:hypothetical protein